MNTGLLILAAGELARSLEELNQWKPGDVRRRDAKVVVGLLRLGINRGEAALRKWESWLGTVETVDIESQDISVGDRVHFPKQDVIATVIATGDSPHPDFDGLGRRFLRLTFDGLGDDVEWYLDVEPSEEFSVLL